VGLSPETGMLLWQVPHAGAAYPHAVTPIIYDDTVVLSGRDLGLSSYRVAQRDGQWTAELAWRSTDVSMALSTPVVNGDYIYALSDRNRGQFVCVDARNGLVAWTSPGREGQMAVILRSDRYLWLFKEQGELVIARAATQAFEPVARYQLADPPAWSTPAITDGLLFVRSGKDLIAWALR
jgi:hypothetical protein